MWKNVGAIQAREIVKVQLGSKLNLDIIVAINLFRSFSAARPSANLSFSLCTESCLPWVPEQGTVGASGDLAPLSHLALGLLGEGQMWSPKSGWADADLVSRRGCSYLFRKLLFVTKAPSTLIRINFRMHLFFSPVWPTVHNKTVFSIIEDGAFR